MENGNALCRLTDLKSKAWEKMSFNKRMCKYDKKKANVINAKSWVILLECTGEKQLDSIAQITLSSNLRARIRQRTKGLVVWDAAGSVLVMAMVRLADEYALTGYLFSGNYLSFGCELLYAELKKEFGQWRSSRKYKECYIQANLEKLNDKVQLEESKARSKFGLGFGETFGSDEVFDPSAPSIFDTTPEDVAEKPLYDRFVKAVGMHAVPPPITGTFMPPSNNPDLDDTQFTYGSKSNNYLKLNSVSNEFVSCDNSDKSSDSEPLALHPVFQVLSPQALRPMNP
ncbi:hypothetical protein Tco_0380886 [Tanacetum coccineum]